MILLRINEFCSYDGALSTRLPWGYQIELSDCCCTRQGCSLIENFAGCSPPLRGLIIFPMGAFRMLGVGFGPGDDSAPGHVTLWRAVLLKAIDDATRVSVHCTPYALAGPSARDQIAARNWLLSSGDEFELVCHLANLAPEQVATWVRSCAASGWRIPKNVKPLRRNVGTVVRIAA